MDEDVHSLAVLPRGRPKEGLQDPEVLVHVGEVGQGKRRLGGVDEGTLEEAPGVLVPAGHAIGKARQHLDLAPEGEVRVGVHPHQPCPGQRTRGIEGLDHLGGGEPQHPYEHRLKGAQAETTQLIQGVLQARLVEPQQDEVQDDPFRRAETCGFSQPLDVLGQGCARRHLGSLILRLAQGRLEVGLDSHRLVLPALLEAPIERRQTGRVRGLPGDVGAVAALGDEPAPLVEEPEDPEAEDGVVGLRDEADRGREPASTALVGTVVHGTSWVEVFIRDISSTCAWPVVRSRSSRAKPVAAFTIRV